MAGNLKRGNGPKFRDGMVLPSAAQVAHGKKALSPGRGGDSLSFAFRWRSQAERSVCLSGPSPLQGLGPRSLTPPLAHSSPGSSPGSNAPNPLAGNYAVMPAMKIHGDLHSHFAFHRGIGDGPPVAGGREIRETENPGIVGVRLGRPCSSSRASPRFPASPSPCFQLPGGDL